MIVRPRPRACPCLVMHRSGIGQTYGPTAILQAALAGCGVSPNRVWPLRAHGLAFARGVSIQRVTSNACWRVGPKRYIEESPSKLGARVMPRGSLRANLA